MNYRILIVDDDVAIQTAIKLALKNESNELLFASNPTDALQLLNSTTLPDLLLLDLHFPKASGLDLLKDLNNRKINLPCLLISGAATAKEAVVGIQLGAFDYIEKPLSSERLKISIERCMNHHHQWLILNSLTSPSYTSNSLIGTSLSIAETKNLIARYAPTEARVLITGETGTGKEVVSQLIVQKSLRLKKPFLILNAAAIPESLMESELFGHRRGSFTGAITDRVGKIEMADQGTLFLDEIGDLSLAAQAKLLRFLETGEIQRVGDSNIKKVDVRVIAATSRNLEKMIKAGEFRSDLFYRLNVARIHLPPLRERRSDIIPLFKYFVNSLQERMNRSDSVSYSLSIEAIQMIENYPWPGNVRELKSFSERCCFENTHLIDKNTVQTLLYSSSLGLFTADQKFNEDPNAKLASSSLKPEIDNDLHLTNLTLDSILPLKTYKNNIERTYIEAVVKLCDGNISRAASKLEIDRSHLHQKINSWKNSIK